MTWVFNSPDSESHLTPGEKCPSCARKIPYPKKATSPKTKVKSIRIPIGDLETFTELIDAAAEHLGFYSKPHSDYNTLLAGLVLILQTPKRDLTGDG